MNGYAIIAGIVVLVYLIVYLWLFREDKSVRPAPIPVQPKPRTRPAPPPPAAKSTPKPAPPKSADQVFREAFPGVQLKPIFDKPFMVRAEACELRDKVTRAEQPGFRIDVRGDIEVARETIVDLVITLEDLSDGSSQPVYATQERYQDEQTGQFVLRSTIGKVSHPGRTDSGWTTVGVVPFSNIRAPKSGERKIRLSCLAVPTAISGLAVVDERIRTGMIAAATVHFEVDLVRKGYVEQRFARQNAAGLVVFLGFAFAQRLRLDAGQAEAAAKGWIAGYLAQMKGEDVRLIEQTGKSVEAAYVMAARSSSDLKVICRELLAYEVGGMADEGLRICVETGRVAGVLPADVLSELKGLCRELGLGLEQLHRYAEAGSASGRVEDDQANAILVGLDLRWDPKRIRRHLLEQFMKWNSRHPKDSAERETISRRLEAIAKLRQRYLWASLSKVRTAAERS